MLDDVSKRDTSDSGPVIFFFLSSNYTVYFVMCKVDISYLLAMESRVQAQWRIIIKH